VRSRWAGPANGGESPCHCEWNADGFFVGPLCDRGLCLPASTRGQRAVRHSSIHGRIHARHVERATAAVIRQPGNLRAHRHADHDRGRANASHRNLRSMKSVANSIGGLRFITAEMRIAQVEPEYV